MEGALDGASCAAHAGAQATGTCERCGNFLCPLCTDLFEEDGWCEACRERAGGRVPFEREEDGGLLYRWYATARAFVFSPRDTLDRTRPGSLQAALMHNALTGVFSGLIAGGLGLCLVAVLARMVSRELDDVAVAVLVMSLAAPLVMPVYTLLATAVRGTVYYVALVLVGGGDARAAYWVTAYLGSMHLAHYPIAMLQRLPIVGAPAGLLLQLGVEVWYALQLTHAAERYHGLTGGKATFAGWAGFVVLACLVLSLVATVFVGAAIAVR